MTRNSVALTCLMAWLIFLALPAQAAYDRGNGGDRRDVFDGSAWFTDSDRDVTTCVEIAAGFNVDLATATATVAKVFTIWRDYYVTKGVNQAWGPSFKFRMTAICRGDEDLAIYLGVESERINSARSAYYDPIAFAERESYDQRSGWGKGFIWVAMPAPSAFARVIASAARPDPISSAPGSPGHPHPFPDWTRGDTLTGVLLHEMGHVLGVPHVPGTIMDEDIVEMLQSANWTLQAQASMSSIDNYAELLGTALPSYSVEGFFGEMALLAPNLTPEDRLLFAAITGRQPRGNVRAKLAARAPADEAPSGPNPETGVFTRLTTFDLVLTDDGGEVNLVVTTKATGVQLGSRQFYQIFRAARIYSIPGLIDRPASQFASSASTVFTGLLHAADATTQPVVFAYDMSANRGLNRPLLLYVITNGDLRPLFGVKRPGE